MNIRKAWSPGRSLAVLQCLVLALLALAGLALVLAIFAGPALVLVFAARYAGRDGNLPLAFSIAVAGLGLWAVLAPLAVTAARPLTSLARVLAARWCGIPVLLPDGQDPPSAGIWRRATWLATDPAARRDLAWLVLSGLLSGVMLLVPAALAGTGLGLFIGSDVIPAIPPPAYPGNNAGSVLIAGLALTVTGLILAPWLLRLHGMLASLLLRPALTSELERRVRHLALTRTETIDAGAAEIRRIERDLHDGAQARLVAMGMALDAASQLIDDDPAAARALLTEARDSSVKALAELRALVRGIHPPVLADRGLAEAIRALALDTPLRIQLASDLAPAARPPAPVESAAYFAVNELIANVTKHARASEAWIDIRYHHGMLRISVTDDGQGGADPARGSGLSGIERRLAAFDGVLALSSPPGGPTAVTLDIPCVLS